MDIGNSLKVTSQNREIQEVLAYAIDTCSIKSLRSICRTPCNADATA
jgi:hypothetical protein